MTLGAAFLLLVGIILLLEDHPILGLILILWVIL
jgi:hypothetical protein